MKKLHYRVISDGGRCFKKYPADAGIDLYSRQDIELHPFSTIAIPTGVAVNIKPNFFGLIVPRSSFRAKGLIIQAIIDAHYIDELSPFVTLIHNVPLTIAKGERFCQLIILPVSLPVMTEIAKFQISKNTRGLKGAGSTGRT